METPRENSLISPPEFVKDAAYWRRRAEEAQAQAEELRDPAARRLLLGIADNYNQLAQQAEALSSSGRVAF